ncbi:hypothetical protein K501DRAFT_169753 [Backusella circina FSU 941]|nr:hypothetical protein K501DRAFT_169753 [Backusella circina FSU 941]
MKFLRLLTRFIDQGSPLLIYSLMKIWASNVIALVIAMVPPILRIAYFLIVFKHIDPCGVLYLAAFVIAACLTPIPADSRNKVIVDSSIVIIMGGMFIISLIPLRFGKFHNRPLIYLNSKKMFEKAEYVRWKDPSTGEKHKMEVHEWAYTYYPTFKKTCVAFTGIYGTLFILVFVARVAMVKSNLSISDLADDSMIISLCVNIGVGIVILFFIRILLNKVDTISTEWKIQNGFQ